MEPTPSEHRDVGAERDLLLLVLDLNPVWWGLDSGAGGQWSLRRCLESATAFANAHLVLRPDNEVAVLGATPDASRFLFPRPAAPAASPEPDPDAGDGKCELFAAMDAAVKTSAQALVRSQTSLRVDLSLAGAVAKALCFAQRRRRQLEAAGGAGRRLRARVLVVKGSEERPGQYMALMNAVFSAQKLGALVDACVLGSDESGLLQQAAALTGGLYLRVEQPDALLQHLLTVFLARPGLRPKLAMPGRPGVDFRAACFCHRRLVDVGYVCSVCLSVFCAFSPFCTTCQTQFKLPAAAAIPRKRQRRG